jgi:lipid-A-disaccharide synthase
MDERVELFVVAGEPSGDTHGSHLLRALSARLPGLAAEGLGGPRLADAGMDVHFDLASDAIMGLFPVIRALPRLRRLFRDAVSTLRDRRPSAVLLIDYPGFNLRLAAAAHRLGIPVIYYISPQVWAWARWRIKKLARVVDLMLVILPFEEDVYAASGLRTVFVGHPLMDHLRTETPDPATLARLQAPSGRPLVGLFPGSRRHVVRSLLPVFIDAARRLRAKPGTEDARFVVALAQEGFRSEMDRLGPQDLPLDVLVGHPYAVMAAADLCLTSSGTTTLEIAAHGTPFVLGYRVSPLLYALGRALVSVDHIGLVNLVAGRRVVPEHVGVRSFASEAAKDLHRLWTDPVARDAQIDGLREVRARLVTQGSYERAADAVVDLLAARGA